MNNFLTTLCSPRVRISVLLTVSVLAILFCFINLPIVYVGLIEALALAGCIAFFRKVDVTQYELFQYKPHWFWRICEWYWALYLSFGSFEYLSEKFNSTICINSISSRYSLYAPALLGIETNSLLNLITNHKLLAFIALLNLPIFLIVIRYIFYHINLFIKSMSIFEKIYFLFFSTTYSIILLITCTATSFLTYPVDVQSYDCERNGVILYNSVSANHFFDTDTSNLLTIEFYKQGNTSRHPYYSYVSMFFFPLLILLSLCLNCCFVSYAYSFAIGLSIIQIFLYCISGIILNRFFQPICNTHYSRLISVLYACSFPMVFIFIPERLILSEFLAVLSLYLILNTKYNIISVIVSIMAIGSTSLSIAPLAFAYFVKRKVTPILIIFASLLIPTCFHGLSWWKSNIYGIQHEYNPVQKIVYYNQFLCSCFVYPEWTIFHENAKTVPVGNNKTANIASKLLLQSKIKQSVIFCWSFGIIILSLCAVTFIKFWKNSLIQILFLWLLSSFGIIAVIGFGIRECVMYCSYFSWAIIPLAMLPFYWLWQKFPRLPVPQALYVFAAYLAISNLYFIYQVVQIVSERYIVPPGM